MDFGTKSHKFLTENNIPPWECREKPQACTATALTRLEKQTIERLPEKRTFAEPFPQYSSGHIRIVNRTHKPTPALLTAWAGRPSAAGRPAGSGCPPARAPPWRQTGWRRRCARQRCLRTCCCCCCWGTCGRCCWPGTSRAGGCLGGTCSVAGRRTASVAVGGFAAFGEEFAAFGEEFAAGFAAPAQNRSEPEWSS